MVAMMSAAFSLDGYHPGMTSFRALLADVEAIYRRLDAELTQHQAAGECRACGVCCDFEAFGHRLYLTTPELLYFAHYVGQPFRPMANGVCPYRIDRRCGVYGQRFAACRIFQCQGGATIQSDLTEQTLAQLKELCTRYAVPYRYVDLKTALCCSGRL